MLGADQQVLLVGAALPCDHADHGAIYALCPASNVPANMRP